MREASPQAGIPSHPGQAVRSTVTGRLGITTDGPAKRTPTIPVQFLGAPYPVRVELDDLVTTEITDTAS